MNGTALSYRADATVNDSSTCSRLATPSTAAIADPRYQSAINLHVTADGEGTSPAEMRVNASGSGYRVHAAGGRIPS